MRLESQCACSSYCRKVHTAVSDYCINDCLTAFSFSNHGTKTKIDQIWDILIHAAGSSRTCRTDWSSFPCRRWFHIIDDIAVRSISIGSLMNTTAMSVSWQIGIISSPAICRFSRSWVNICFPRGDSSSSTAFFMRAAISSERK